MSSNVSSQKKLKRKLETFFLNFFIIQKIFVSKVLLARTLIATKNLFMKMSLTLDEFMEEVRDAE